MTAREVFDLLSQGIPFRWIPRDISGVRGGMRKVRDLWVGKEMQDIDTLEGDQTTQSLTWLQMRGVVRTYMRGRVVVEELTEAPFPEPVQYVQVSKNGK